MSTVCFPIKQKNEVRVVLYDYLDKSWVKNRNWYIDGNGYCVSFYKNYYTRKCVSLYMHREVIGALKDKHVDHINGNPLDNRNCNLRICDNQQNHHNTKLGKSNTSGYKGVTLLKSGKWQALIQYNNRSIYLGTFNVIQDAAKAYNEAANKYHKEFARLNII